MGYVVDDRVGDYDIVVYEGEAGLGTAVAAEDRETPDSGARGADDVFGLGVGDFDFFALENDEFGVDSYLGTFQYVFFVRNEGMGGVETASAVSK